MSDSEYTDRTDRWMPDADIVIICHHVIFLPKCYTKYCRSINSLFMSFALVLVSNLVIYHYTYLHLVKTVVENFQSVRMAKRFVFYQAVWKGLAVNLISFRSFNARPSSVLML